MSMKQVLAKYGDLIYFKHYGEYWVVESAIEEEDGKIRVTKITDGEGVDTVVHYLNNGKPNIDRRAFAITLDSKEDITKIIPLQEALATEKLFYNQHPVFSDSVVNFHFQNFPKSKAIEIAKLTKQTVLLTCCSNNDQRFYIPVVKEDTLWDVTVRYLVYVHYLPK